MIAVAIGLGLAYTQVPLWPLARRFPPAVAQAILLLVVCVRLLVPKELELIRQQLTAALKMKSRYGSRQWPTVSSACETHRVMCCVRP